MKERGHGLIRERVARPGRARRRRCRGRTRLVHINDQTITDEPIAPFGGVGLSGNGFRVGGHDANLDAFTETQWVTVQQRPGEYPF